jgi:hypothetical protein
MLLSSDKKDKMGKIDKITSSAAQQPLSARSAIYPFYRREAASKIFKGFYPPPKGLTIS